MALTLRGVTNAYVQPGLPTTAIIGTAQGINTVQVGGGGAAGAAGLLESRSPANFECTGCFNEGPAWQRPAAPLCCPHHQSSSYYQAAHPHHAVSLTVWSRTPHSCFLQYTDGTCTVASNFVFLQVCQAVPFVAIPEPDPVWTCGLELEGTFQCGLREYPHPLVCVFYIRVSAKKLAVQMAARNETTTLECTSSMPAFNTNNFSCLWCTLRQMCLKAFLSEPSAFSCHPCPCLVACCRGHSVHKRWRRGEHLWRRRQHACQHHHVFRRFRWGPTSRGQPVCIALRCRVL